MKERDMQLERILKALANRRRIAILRFLKKHKEATVGGIALEIKLSFKSTSRHLSVLSTANILDREQKSSNVFYRMSADLPAPAQRIIAFL